MTDTVLCEVENAVARVILNRPDKLNALNADMWRAVGEIFGDLSGDASLRCVVLTGQGERAFSPGADIKEFETARADIEKARAYGELMHGAMGEIGACPHPTLAAIRGLCVGGGLELASVCDIRICGKSSRFGVPINRLGLTMSYSEVKTLRDIAGTAGALEVLLRGDVFGSDRAYELGLVSQVTPDDELLKTAYELAQQISERAPLVNRWHKKFIRRLSDPTPLTAEELDEGFAAYDTEDYRIGYESFLAKKKPSFTGK